MLALQRIAALFFYRRLNKKYADDEGRRNREKWKLYLANGAVFVPLDISLAGVVTLMIRSGELAATGTIMAITTATYTFYKIIRATMHFIKAKKGQDPVTQIARNIGLVDAFASMLSLEVTLISSFGAMDSDMLLIVAISGFAVCIFTVGFGAYMIINAAKKLGCKEKDIHEKIF